MAPPSTDIIFVLLQYLYDCCMYESANNLEQETKVYFNLKSFLTMVEHGHWEDVEKYLRSFTNPSDSHESMMVFWKIGREKYLESLDQKDSEKALSVFEKDLKPLWLTTPECSEELIGLIPLQNFRENLKYAMCGDTKSMRAQLAVELMESLKLNPMIKHKLNFPKIDESRLKTLLSQSADWQHFICHNDAANPSAVSTLFADHNCGRSPSVDRRHSVDVQLIPNRNYQNHGDGPSFAPCTSRPNFDSSNFCRP